MTALPPGSLVNPVVGRGMNLVVLDATRKDLSPVLAWLAARGADTSRLGFVGFGEGCEAVAATRAAHPDAVRAAMLLSPDPATLVADDWLETPLFLYEAGAGRAGLEELVVLLRPGGRAATRLPATGPRGGAFLDERGNPALIANWMRDLLVRTVYLTVPRYEEGDARVAQPGFLDLVRRVGREQGGARYELMAYQVGELWTVGAMVHGAFAGTVTFEVEGHQLALQLDTGALPEEGVPVSRNGAASELVGTAASSGGWTWVTLELPAPLPGAQLALRFEPGEGEALRLPGRRAHFAVHLAQR